MASSHINIRTSGTLLEELDSLVASGFFGNGTEAVNEGLRLPIRRYDALRIAEKMAKKIQRKITAREISPS